MYVPNVFQTAYQTCPLDLHTDAFYPTRVSEVNRRLVDIGNGQSETIIRELHEKESENKTCIVGLDWNFDLEDLLDIVKVCFPIQVAKKWSIITRRSASMGRP